LRHSSGEDPRRLRWGVEGFVEGSTGTFDFARPSVVLRGTAPLGRALVLGLEGAAGASVGDVPAQSLWLLGGPMSLRGYDGAAMRGNAFWRGRAELSNTFAGARVSLFTDVGWAGDGSEWETGTPLVSVGLGGSALDGLLRVDLARTLRSPIDWRLHLYLDGLL
ncbi:MAG: BamA/TamA family outer membrane protein, partial [Myxococcota bacterium]